MPDIAIDTNDITRGYLISPEAIHYPCELPYPPWRLSELESPTNGESDHFIPAPTGIHDRVRQHPLPDKTQSPEQPSPHFWFGEEVTPRASSHQKISTMVKKGSFHPSSLPIGSFPDDANATRSPSILQILRSIHTPNRCAAGTPRSTSLALYKEYENRLQFHERHLRFRELPSRCRFAFWLDGLPEPSSGHTSLKDRFREKRPGAWAFGQNPKPNGLGDQDAACQSRDCPSLKKGKPRLSERNRPQAGIQPTTASSSQVKEIVMVEELPSVNLGRSLPNEDISKILNTCKPSYPQKDSIENDTFEPLPSEVSSSSSWSGRNKETQAAENIEFCRHLSSRTASMNISRSSEVDRVQPKTSSNRLPESNQDECRSFQNSSGGSQDWDSDPPPAPTSKHQHSSDESNQYSAGHTSDSNTDGNPYTPPHSFETSKELPRSSMRDRQNLFYSHPPDSFETAPLHQGVQVEVQTPPSSLKLIVVDDSTSEGSLWGSSPFCCRCI